MAAATPDNRCDMCKSKGLAVYMARYTAVPNAFNAPDLGPFSGEKVKSIALSQSKYALRQLREGFVYLFYELGAEGKFYWEVYAVGPDAALWKQKSAAMATGVSSPQTCGRSGHEMLRPLYLVIENPEQCGKVWVAFSERIWSDETVKRYGGSDAAAAQLRARRMQPIEPAKWITAQTAAEHKAPLTQENLEHVIECSPQIVLDIIPEAKDLPYTGLPDQISAGAQGAFLQKQLEACGTRYPWTMRSWNKWAGPRSDVAQLIVQAKASTTAACPPMMLALWDGVGMTHELNGYRNDAQARFLQYCDEQALQINALEWIDQAKQAVHARAKNFATFDNSAAISGSTGWYDPAGVAKSRAAASTPEDQQFWSDYEWMGKNGVPSYISQQLVRLRSVPSSSGYQQVLTQARAHVDNKARSQAKRDKKIEQDTETDSARDWEKYEEQLIGDSPGKTDPKLLETFRAFYQSIRNKKQQLLAQRTPDVAAWLGAPLLLDTLEDYHEDNLLDGAAFEFAIFNAIVGMSADPAGGKVLDGLLDKMDPTTPESIVWRMVAANQQQSKAELKLALARAEAHKETILGSAKEGYNIFAETSEKLKKFAEVFQKMEELSKNVKQLNAVDQLIHDKGVDKVMVAIGDFIFKRFGFKGFNLENMANAVGEGIIHMIFLARVGVGEDAAREIVLQQAHLEPELRRQFFDDYKVLRDRGLKRDEAFRLANQSLAESEGSRRLAESWKKLKAPAAVGVVSVVAAIEVFGLIKLVIKSDKEGRDYAEIAGACFSVASAGAEVVMKPLETLKLERSAAISKAIGGYCGSVAAAVGMTLDFQDAVQKGSNGEMFVAMLYATKGVLGAGTSTALLLTALSSSAPFLERVATKVCGSKIRFVLLGRIGQGVLDATQRRADILAGKAAAEVAADVGAERLGMMALGRFMLFLASWEIQVAIISIQVVIWIFANDDLQNAITQSVFGVEQKYKAAIDLEKQDQCFDKALVAVGLKSKEETKVAEEVK